MCLHNKWLQCINVFFHVVIFCLLKPAQLTVNQLKTICSHTMTPKTSRADNNLNTGRLYLKCSYLLCLCQPVGFYWIHLNIIFKWLIIWISSCLKDAVVFYILGNFPLTFHTVSGFRLSCNIFKLHLWSLNSPEIQNISE